jgi:dienelactone hydrolase
MSGVAGTTAGFDAFAFEAGGRRKTVFVRGEGRAVLLMHDMAGLTPECLVLARRLARGGLRVYVPLLFGWPGQASRVLGLGQALLSRDFNLFADEGPGALTDWLRPLCREISARDGWRRIGVIGMGITGSLVFSLLMEPCVWAPVTSHPSTPFPLAERSRTCHGIPEQHLVNLRTRSDVRLLGWRFSEDRLCPPQRFRRLAQLMGRRFDGREIPSGEGTAFAATAHGVLDSRKPQTPPIPDAIERTTRFLVARLGAAEPGEDAGERPARVEAFRRA